MVPTPASGVFSNILVDPLRVPLPRDPFFYLGTIVLHEVAYLFGYRNFILVNLVFKIAR
jgi:hypothetical protein